jgi:hypothetical protein
VGYPGSNHATSQLPLVGSPLTSLRHLLGLLNSASILFNAAAASWDHRHPRHEEHLHLNQKIRIKRDLVSLYFNFIYLSFIWLFHNLGCGWDDVGSRCCFWLVLCFPKFPLAFCGCVWSDSSCTWQKPANLSSIVLCRRSLITWSKAGKKDDAHWLTAIAVSVTMTMSHMLRPMEYDDSEAARGSYREQINPICEVLHRTWLEI